MYIHNEKSFCCSPDGDRIIFFLNQVRNNQQPGGEGNALVRAIALARMTNGRQNDILVIRRK